MADPVNPSDRAALIFDHARQLAAAARESYLREACGGDRELRRLIDELLAAHAKQGDFMADPTQALPSDAGEAAGAADGSPGGTTELPASAWETPEGKRIGPYKLLQRIGEGGFGEVWMAEQREPIRRRVALKIIKPGMDSRQVIARFEVERQALAMMDHPNIARVLDAGVTDSGRPYFVMELVRGVPITEYADTENLDTQARLELFALVCCAVQHAHQKGIIHRDLKPSNVLVTVTDGKPVPKVIDFGIAKATGGELTDKTLFTEFRQFIGTPQYMSPEQAEMSGVDIDTRSDIYALGVLLYELLTGVTPFDAARLRSAALEEMRRIIREEDPPRPSTRVSTLGDGLSAVARHRRVEPARLGALIRGDLDWITMKCLEKDRGRRYGTASDLAADVQRHLTGEAVVAAPPSRAYRARKFVRRHRGAAVAGSLVAAVLVLGIVGTSLGLVSANQERQGAEKAREAAEWNVYVANIGLAQAAMMEGMWPDARERLSRCPEQFRGFEWAFLNEQAHSVLFMLHNVRNAVFSPDGTRILTVSDDRQVDGVPIPTEHERGTVRLWDMQGRSIGAPMRHEGWVSVAMFSGNGKRVLTGSNRNMIQLWDARTGKPVGAPMRHDGGVRSEIAAHFSPDGLRILTRMALEGTVRVWDAASCTAVGQPIKHDSDVNSAVFSPDSTLVLTASEDGTARLWNANTGMPHGEIMRHDVNVRSAVFSADGTRVLTRTTPTASALCARLWDGVMGQPVGQPMCMPCGVDDAVFSPDGALILTISSLCNRAQLWDATTGLPVGEPMQHESDVGGGRFSPDGTRVLTYGWDGIARLWDTLGRSVREPMRHDDRVSSAVFSPDGARVLTVSWDLTTRLWDSQGRPIGEPMLCNKSYLNWATFSPDGQHILTGFGSGSDVVILDAERFGSNQRRFGRDTSPLEVELVVGSFAGETVRPTLSERPLKSSAVSSRPALDVTSRAVTADATRVVVAASDRTIRFFDAGQREAAVFHLPAKVTDLRFSQDGTRLILMLENGETQIWDARDFSARNVDVEIQWNERALARRWVEQLLDSPTPVEELDLVIARDPSYCAVRKLGALRVLGERLHQIDLQAQVVLRQLQEECISPKHVRTAAAGRNDLHARVREALIAQATAWSPGVRELTDLAWKTAQTPGASTECLVSALEVARIAASDGETYRTLGATLYRSGSYKKALEALLKSEQLDRDGDDRSLRDGRPTCLAFLAMAQWQLESADDARETLVRLRELVGEPEHSGWKSDETVTALLAEAEALIEGAPAAPASAPATQPSQP